jgi:hypothetical protein
MTRNTRHVLSYGVALAVWFVLAPVPSLATPTVAPSSQLGSDPSVCNDPRIAEEEQRTGTTARLFPNDVNGGKEGQLGRYLETLPDEVYSAGACNTEPGASVEFIYNGRIADANKIASELFAGGSGPAATPAGGQPGGGQPGAHNFDDTYTTVATRCAMNDDKFTSCSDPNLLIWCKGRALPACTIVAQGGPEVILRPAVPKLDPIEEPRTWKGEFRCDGKTCIFTDTKGGKWKAPQRVTTAADAGGGTYDIVPATFKINRQGSLIAGSAEYRLVSNTTGLQKTMRLPVNLQ